MGVNAIGPALTDHGESWGPEQLNMDRALKAGHKAARQFPCFESRAAPNLAAENTTTRSILLALAPTRSWPVPRQPVTAVIALLEAGVQWSKPGG